MRALFVLATEVESCLHCLLLMMSVILNDVIVRLNLLDVLLHLGSDAVRQDPFPKPYCQGTKYLPLVLFWGILRSTRWRRTNR